MEQNARPTKTRGLKKADRETDFSFIRIPPFAFLIDSHPAGRGKNEGKKIQIKSAVVRLKEGHVVEMAATARLDPGTLKALGSKADSLAVKGLKKYLTMDNSIRLEFLVSSAKGKGFVKVLSVRIKEVVLPDSLVREVLQVVGEQQRPPLNFNRMFVLPNGIQKVEILPGKLRLQILGL